MATESVPDLLAALQRSVDAAKAARRKSAMMRAAARKMRHEASAATPGPWEPLALGSEGYAVLAEPPADSGRRSRIRVSRNGWEDWDTDQANAHHIAAWPPEMALAIADWLEECADDVDRGISYDAHALTVASTFLGWADA